jgi:hypothetical protein
MPRRLLREMGARGLRQMAGDYLRENPGLVERAAEAVEKDPVLRRIAEGERRQLKRCQQ